MLNIIVGALGKNKCTPKDFGPTYNHFVLWFC